MGRPASDLRASRGRVAPWGQVRLERIRVRHFAARFDGSHQEEPVAHSVHYDNADNRIDIRVDGGGTNTLWWATKNEWLGLIDVAGLELAAMYGDFDGSPIGPSSREYVVIATRP